MTELERKMYQILGRVSETDAPIVFVGGLITKLVLAENGFATISGSSRYETQTPQLSQESCVGAMFQFDFNTVVVIAFIGA
jgi:hypothetical protein